MSVSVKRFVVASVAMLVCPLLVMAQPQGGTPPAGGDSPAKGTDSAMVLEVQPSKGVKPLTLMLHGKAGKAFDSYSVGVAKGKKLGNAEVGEAIAKSFGPVARGAVPKDWIDSAAKEAEQGGGPEKAAKARASAKAALDHAAKAEFLRRAEAAVDSGGGAEPQRAEAAKKFLGEKAQAAETSCEKARQALPEKARGGMSCKPLGGPPPSEGAPGTLPPAPAPGQPPSGGKPQAK